MDKMDEVLATYGLKLFINKQEAPEDYTREIIRKYGIQDVYMVIRQLNKEKATLEIANKQRFINKMKIGQEIKELPKKTLSILYLDIFATDDVYSNELYVIPRFETNKNEREIVEIIKQDILKRSDYYGLQETEMKMQELFGESKELKEKTEETTKKFHRFMEQYGTRGKRKVVGEKIKKAIREMIKVNNENLGG